MVPIENHPDSGLAMEAQHVSDAKAAVVVFHHQPSASHRGQTVESARKALQRVAPVTIDSTDVSIHHRVVVQAHRLQDFSLNFDVGHRPLCQLIVGCVQHNELSRVERHSNALFPNRCTDQI